MGGVRRERSTIRNYQTLVGTFVSLYSLVGRTRLARSRFLDRPYLVAYEGARRLVGDSLPAFLEKFPKACAGHVLDVGANVGFASRRFVRRLGASQCLLAVEPDHANLRRLHLALRRQVRTGRLTIVGAAVGAADGNAQLWRNTANPSDHRVVTRQWAESLPPGEHVDEVPMRSIDSLVSEYGLSPEISLVKIDVQGYEIPVMEGMRQTIRDNPSMWVLLEYAPSVLRELGFEPSDVLRTATELGLSPSIVADDGRLLDIAELDRELRGTRYVDLLLSREPFGASG